MERVAHIQSLLLHISQVLIKVILIRNFTLLLKALGKECNPMFHETGPLWKQTPISKALLSISFGVPSKGALPPGSPHIAPTERNGPFPETSIFQSPQ
jgi:hypothetical protein